MEHENKSTFFKQFLKVTGTSLFLCLLMGFMTFACTTLTKSWKIVSVIILIFSLILYFLMMYSAAFECGKKDVKANTEKKPFVLKGFFLSLGIVAVNFLVWGLYRYMWSNYPVVDVPILKTTLATVLYTVISSPYAQIIKVNGGSYNIIGQYLSYIVPVISCIIGYFCGRKGFDINKYINAIIFEKNK